MKSREGHKGYVIEARSCELKDGGFSAEFSVEEHAQWRGRLAKSSVGELVESAGLGFHLVSR
jgi:hypothetical protein